MNIVIICISIFPESKLKFFLIEEEFLTDKLFYQYFRLDNLKTFDNKRTFTRKYLKGIPYTIYIHRVHLASSFFLFSFLLIYEYEE